MKELTAKDLIYNWDHLLSGAQPEKDSLESIIGQPRGLKALAMGMKIAARGYNIWVSGHPGTGRKTALKKLLAEQPVNPDLKDIVYVHNFDDPSSPRPLYLPQGTAHDLRLAVDDLISYLVEEIRKSFKSKNYILLRDKMVHEVDKKENHLLSDLEMQLQAENFKIVQLEESGENLDIWPVFDGEPVPFDALQSKIAEGSFTEEDWAKLRERYYFFVERLKGIIEELRKTRKNLEKRIKDLKEKQIASLIREEVEKIGERFDSPSLAIHLRGMIVDILDHLHLFVDESPEDEVMEGPLGRYAINVLVDHGSRPKRPVVYEFHPTNSNLFGSLEYRMEPTGETKTSFMMIQGGALHKASGGFLILSAEDILQEESLYKVLKKVLLTGDLEIHIATNPFGSAPSSLKPIPVKVGVKVIVLGPSGLYEVLATQDPEFLELFKVSAEFDDVMPRSLGTTKEYLLFMEKTIRDKGLLPLNQDGQGAVVEYGIRLAEHREKLSTRFSAIADLLLEASYWAGEMGRSEIDSQVVQKTLTERNYLFGLREEKMDEMFQEGQILISTQGKEVGQVNGLAVFEVGLSSFGRPVRITATSSPGKEGIINIEGEAGLSGEIHNKGVLILQGLLKSRFAVDFPLSLSAAVAMEQSYVGVDGDSASSTEIYALISAITGIPLRQDLAVSGSINQMGQIQPVGGINEKVEGFWEICSKFGLTGSQGVIIPHANIPHLIPDPRVQKAIQEKRFHIYAIKDFTEGLELLTGQKVGNRDEKGKFSQGSLGELIVLKLHELAKISQTLDKL